MKKKNKHLGWIIALLITTAVILLVRHFHIKNFCVIEPGAFYTSGQPRGMDYTRLLYKYHIATIVNVRSAYEHREKNWYSEEITFVRDNSIKYFELPIGKNNPFPGRKIQDAFLDIMADKTNRPVLMHSGSGGKRIAMLTAVWLIKTQNSGPKQAVKIAEKIKKEPLTETERKFIEDLSN